MWPNRQPNGTGHRVRPARMEVGRRSCRSEFPIIFPPVVCLRRKA
ncbi:hypothetical protein [Komagataeibacter sp. FNDCF1]|nr:hypothetical protein [Komagataeibacter sp. FNDCF1]